MNLLKAEPPKILPVTLHSGHRRRRSSIRYIVVHHSNTATPERTREVLSDKGLSTHFEVDQAGRVLQYFDPEKIVTFHAGEFNSHAIGIDLTHIHRAPWPPLQVDVGHWLIRMLLKRFDLPLKVAPEGVRFRGVASLLETDYTVVRHNNLKNTLCPDGLPLDMGGVANE